MVSMNDGPDANMALHCNCGQSPALSVIGGVDTHVDKVA